MSVFYTEWCYAGVAGRKKGGGIAFRGWLRAEGCAVIAIDHIELAWVRQGVVLWEDTWVERHGRTRSHEPSLEEHVGFANHDLRLHSLPEITRGSDSGLEIRFDPYAVTGLARDAGPMVVLPLAVGRLMAVVEPHGFALRGRQP